MASAPVPRTLAPAPSDLAPAPSPDSSITFSHGFVDYVTLPPPGSSSNSWQSSTGVSFGVFMAIGFGCTLSVIGLIAAAVWAWRRWRRRPVGVAHFIDPESAETEMQPKNTDNREMCLVIHPGGGADVARKESLGTAAIITAKMEDQPGSPASETIPAFRQSQYPTSSLPEEPASETLYNTSAEWVTAANRTNEHLSSYSSSARAGSATPSDPFYLPFGRPA